VLTPPARPPRAFSGRRRAALALPVLCSAFVGWAGAETFAPPEEIYGDLFVAVQRAPVFSDQKTFPDAVPLTAPATILARYAEARQGAGFDLAAFVRSSFAVPEEHALAVPQAKDLEDHLNSLWTLLRRAPDQGVVGSSLLPLPQPYVVPGGRFREVYYWDSYFTMLGLRQSGRKELIRSMVDNFAYELRTFGHVPNGNRTYYLSRSQPPFFALMVELLAAQEGDAAYREYGDALEREYAYWMDRSAPTRHLVTLPDGAVLNRYFDQKDTPRAEAFATDEATARGSSQPPRQLYRNLRSAAESGWDFSSRWLRDERALGSIATTEIVPVDLNCLLYQLELTLAKARRVNGDAAGAGAAERAAQQRRGAIQRVFWSAEERYFFDFDLARGTRRTAWTLAGAVPLFLRVATPAQAAGVAAAVRNRFLRPGGVVTTLVTTGQQWDAPNGWAPLQWTTVCGLENYGETALAGDIADRWLRLNREVYRRTGKMMEKYNVEDVSLAAGGGEYPSQDGFGWTNGVFLALEHQYPGR
jgi:alpha,alpha-trehalase